MLPGISSSSLRLMAYQPQRTLNRISPVAQSGREADGFTGSNRGGSDTAVAARGQSEALIRTDAGARPAFDFTDSQQGGVGQDVTAHMLSRHNAYVAGQRATGGKGRMSAYESVMNMTA